MTRLLICFQSASISFSYLWFINIMARKYLKIYQHPYLIVLITWLIW